MQAAGGSLLQQQVAQRRTRSDVERVLWVSADTPATGDVTCANIRAGTRGNQRHSLVAVVLERRLTRNAVTRLVVVHHRHVVSAVDVITRATGRQRRLR